MLGGADASGTAVPPEHQTGSTRASYKVDRGEQSEAPRQALPRKVRLTCCRSAASGRMTNPGQK